MTEKIKLDAALALRELDRVLQNKAAEQGDPRCLIYPASRQIAAAGGALCLARTPEAKYLLTVDWPLPFQGARSRVDGREVGIHPLSAANAAVLRECFPWTRPAKLPGGLPSFGCGDRLGLANPGHVRLLKDYKVAPVLAQQSIRELTLTNRTFGQVIDAASWAVLQEGYTDGFGADGDHLKTAAEVKTALEAGVSMVTLDLSLVLGKPGDGACPGALAALAGRSFSFAGRELPVDQAGLAVFWDNYGAALAFVVEADTLCRAARGAGQYDLEISVDETPHTTRPLDHLLLSLACEALGVNVTSMAPRFPGEFQKGVDYRGDLREFAADFRLHAGIAERFGYKIRIHSGSDKFSAFPVVAEAAGGRIHEKTAGTSWLEACRVAAQTAPDLFRRIYIQARDFFPEACKYYHIDTTLADVPGLEDMANEDLPDLLERDASRQYLHITYGQILQAPALGPPLLRLLHEREEEYYLALTKHFRRHAEGLGIARR